MTKDARISTALPGHPKTKKLLKRLGHAGPLACVYLFIWAAANRSDGDLSGMSNEDIELSVDWTGEDGAFVQAMMDVGFLDGQENELVIHDWKEHNPWAAGAKDRSDSSKWAALCKRYGRETAAKRMPDYAERMRPAREPDAETMRNECKPDAPSPSPSPLPSPLPTPLVDASPTGKAKAKRLSPEWQLPKPWGEWALESMAWDAATVRLEAEKFKDYWTAKSGKDATKLDWEATWRNWCRSARPAKQSFAQQAADIARPTVPPAHTGPDPALLKIEADLKKAAPMPEHIRQQINQVLRKA
jgi:hypothetical protein